MAGSGSRENQIAKLQAKLSNDQVQNCTAFMKQQGATDMIRWMFRKLPKATTGTGLTILEQESYEDIKKNEGEEAATRFRVRMMKRREDRQEAKATKKNKPKSSKK